jgi:hypothetical protein
MKDYGRVIKLLVYTSSLGTLLLLGLYYQVFLKHSFLPTIGFLTIFYTVFGALLSLPKFLGKIKENGRWKVDWPKLIIVGIPSLALLLEYFISLSPIGKYVFFNTKITLILHQTSYTVIPVAGIILGYLLFDSIIKNQETIDEP